ncbi:MAG: Uma2 family endonuclease [Acidobacteria bacterium]|jgi:Uma2 family endonuclease|nr:Uma2 family endonuclease [Acidobacteriota bacterium]
MSDPGRQRLLTYADYAALPDDGHRYQLLEGELVMTPSPDRWHQHVSIRLGSELLNHVQVCGLGEAFAAPLDVTLDDRNVVQPDILFVSNERSGILQGDRVIGAPDLCVEILSPGTERIDRVRKLELYARFGVTHYWIVDLDARTIEEYVLAGDVYRARSITAYDAPFRPAALPGFEFRLSVVGSPDGA